MKGKEVQRDINFSLVKTNARSSTSMPSVELHTTIPENELNGVPVTSKHLFLQGFNPKTDSP